MEILMKLLWNAIAIALLTIAVSAEANESDGEPPWHLERDKQGVQIFTRSVDGSPYDEVKGVTLVTAKLSSLVALIRDTRACSDWADLCKESRLHESISATEHYVYTLNDLPWPVANRDVLAHVIWQQNPENLQVTMRSQATTGLLEKNKGVVRLTQAKASWVFKPLGDGQVEVTTMAHVNPGGPLPGWMTNLFLLDSPFNTLVKLKKAVNQPKYEQANVVFIREPEQ